MVGAVRTDDAGHVAGQFFPAAVRHLGCGGLRIEPAALLGDADRQHLILAAVNVVDKIADGNAADLVLAGHAAKQQGDAHGIFRLHADLSYLLDSGQGV